MAIHNPVENQPRSSLSSPTKKAGVTRRRQFNGNRNDGWQRPSARTENSLQRAGDCRQPWSAFRRRSWPNRAQNGWWTHPTNRPTPTWIPCTTNPTADGSVVTWRSPWSWRQTGKCRPTFPPHQAPQPDKSEKRNRLLHRHHRPVRHQIHLQGPRTQEQRRHVRTRQPSRNNGAVRIANTPNHVEAGHRTNQRTVANSSPAWKTAI